MRHLDPQFNAARKPTVQYYALKPLAADCAVLLSIVAHAGSKAAAGGGTLAAFQHQAPPGTPPAQIVAVYHAAHNAFVEEKTLCGAKWVDSR